MRNDCRILVIGMQNIGFGTFALLVVLFFSGMNGAVRAVVRMGFYLGCKVYFIKEVSLFV